MEEKKDNFKYIIIDNHDNVMVALDNFNKGDIVNGISILEDINRGHKVALRDININEHIIKYGYPIGKATNKILKGSLVHIHNTKTLLNDENQLFEYRPVQKVNDQKKQANEELFVNAYLRKNGTVGIRNELWVIPTVGCVNKQAEAIVKSFMKNHELSENFDGAFAFPHPYGCSQLGSDHETTKKVLQNMVKHPNAGGILVLGLGCENNQMKTFIETLNDEGLINYDETRVRFLIAQDVSDEIKEGTRILEELFEKVKEDKRTRVPFSKIKIGLKCGGSDGLSGLTANPLIGRLSDLVISLGGTTVLTEIPEMFGAEQVLLNRTKNQLVFDNLLKAINNFKNYYKENHQVIYENPSPGNKLGGITTLEDKSLGCIQKAGSEIINDVVEYSGLIKEPGLNVLVAPGNDLVATSALGFAGCQLVLFSTGRGTPFGSFIPTVKISTNSLLKINKPNWIDFNSGDINANNYQEILKQFMDFILQVIEGKKICNEINDSHEIAIFKRGVTL